jgi:hypothetical protein
MSNMEEIKKYEKALENINAKISEIDEQRTHFIRQGVRIEGILAYLQGKEQERLAEEKKLADAKKEKEFVASSPSPVAETFPVSSSQAK